MSKTTKKPNTKTLSLDRAAGAAKAAAKAGYGPRIENTSMVKEQDDHSFDVDHLQNLDSALDMAPLISGAAPGGQPDDAPEARPDAQVNTFPKLAPWHRDQFDWVMSNGKPKLRVSNTHLEDTLRRTIPETWTAAQSMVTKQSFAKAMERYRSFFFGHAAESVEGLPTSMHMSVAYALQNALMESFIYSARLIDSLPTSIALAQKGNKSTTVQENMLEGAMVKTVEAATEILALEAVYIEALAGKDAKPLARNWRNAAYAFFNREAYRVQKQTESSPNQATVDSVRISTAELFRSKFLGNGKEESAA